MIEEIRNELRMHNDPGYVRVEPDSCLDCGKDILVTVDPGVPCAGLVPPLDRAICVDCQREERKEATARKYAHLSAHYKVGKPTCPTNGVAYLFNADCRAVNMMALEMGSLRRRARR